MVYERKNSTNLSMDGRGQPDRDSRISQEKKGP